MTVYNISLLSLSYIHPYSSTPALRPNIELIDFLYILILNIYFLTKYAMMFQVSNKDLWVSFSVADKSVVCSWYDVFCTW